MDFRDLAGTPRFRPQSKEAEKMHRFLVAGVLLLAGCQSILGPFSHRKPERVDDPLLSISEQKSRGRNRYALPDESATTGPRTSMESPWVLGRQ
jgi:hypothetical protein